MIILPTFIVSCSNSEDNNPAFLGYVIEYGSINEIVENQNISLSNFQTNNLGKIVRLSDETATQDITTESDITSTKIDSFTYSLLDTQMMTNSGENLVITLRFKNVERDTFVELILNDSDYGDNQLYSTSASINRVLSVDTFYQDETWITDIVIIMPKTTSDEQRNIEITEIVFLRSLIDKRINATLTECESTTLAVQITDIPVETSFIFFEFEENEEGYTAKRLKTDYGIPNLVFIPSYYKGLPVTEIGENFYIGPENISNFGIPATVVRYNGRIVNTLVMEYIYIYSRNMTNNLEYDDEAFGGRAETIIYIYDEFLNCDMGKRFIEINNIDIANEYYNLQFWD